MDQHSNTQPATFQATDVLEFRVSRPGSPIRRLRLTGNRYTFGRDPAATVRLDDLTLQPVHALLLREITGENQRLVLQAMSLPLLVNGRLTTETTLHTGDHFHLGEYQFEFVGVIDATPQPSSPTSCRETEPSHVKTSETPTDDDPTIRADSKAKPSVPRVSFAAGMRLVDENNEAIASGSPTRPEQTLDAIEQALEDERGRSEMAQRGAALQQEREASLRKESQHALARQKMELSQEHRREMETVLQRFAETQRQAASANRAIESMQQQVADLGKQLRTATENKREHQATLDQAAKQRDAAREELRQALAQSQRLISELDAARRDRSEISSSLHDMTIQLYTATTEGDKVQSRARELARQRDEAFQKVEAFGRRCEELTEQLRQAEQTCQTVSDQRDRFAEQLRQRTAERDSAIALADQRSEELTAKESVIDTLRAQVTELEQAVAESRHEAETLRTECQAACESVAKLEEVVRQGEQQRQADRESWETESAELRASVEQISLDLAAASSELARSRETADSLNAELTETRGALADAESEIAVRPSGDELQAIRNRLEATEQQLRQLQNETEGSVSTHLPEVDEPAGAYTETPIETYTETPPEAYAETSAETYANEPSEAYAEAPIETYAETPSETYAETPSETYAETPPETYAETPIETYAEDPSETRGEASPDRSTEGSVAAEAEDFTDRAPNPSPWAIDLNSPWNLATDLEEPLSGPSSVSSQVDESADGEQLSPMAERAEDASPAWQSVELSAGEASTGAFASDLLKQLDATDSSEDPAGMLSSPGAGEYGREEAFSEAAVDFDNEPTMQEEEIEQVREFLRSDDASAEYDAPGEFETSSEDGASCGSEIAEDGTSTFISDPERRADQDPSDEDEDSIEAYMNRLLQRVQGGSTGSYSPPESASVTTEPIAASKETQPLADLEPTAAEPPIDENTPFVPRSQAPERSKNLAAMRELANNSARTAIMSSVRKQAYITALQKFAQAAGSALGASVMLYYSQLRVGWQLVAAICMTLLSAYWVIEALQLQAGLRTEAKREPATADWVTDDIQGETDAEPESSQS